MEGVGYNYLVMSVDCLVHSQHMHTATEAVPVLFLVHIQCI